MSNPSAIHDFLAGVILGGAVGDALGLPGEGLSPARQRKLWPGELRHRFLFGRGMISDDTEHAFMTAQALLEANGDVERFRRSLAWKLRWWFVALPAGVGLATARACVRLWFGISAERSGVNSAGNGPAMRSAILGAVFADDMERRRAFVRASTRLTHLDPRAEVAALAVAEAAAWIVDRGRPNPSPDLRPPSPHPMGRGQGEGLGDLLRTLSLTGTRDEEWLRLCDRMAEALAAKETVGDFNVSLGLADGVTGYAYHTVPVALYAWLRHRGDFAAAVSNAIRCGGDTDTVAAIVGALAGCDVGAERIPVHWREGLMDWPRSPRLLGRLAEGLGSPIGKPVRWCWPGVLPRNLFFLAVVLTHGFRRLLPPY
jgi:ADP-ribosyl-[dinitrogen reductase] hydrolase